MTAIPAESTVDAARAARRRRVDDRELVRALKSRPGRGGVRLSYEQADRLLELLALLHRLALAERRWRIAAGDVW